MQKYITPKSRTKARYANNKGLSAKVTAVTALTNRSKEVGDVKPGDTVKVHTRIREGEKERIQLFEGTVIRIKNLNGRRTITVRKNSHGVGVERIFLDSSPTVAKIERVQSGQVRRAKLYYLRGLEGKAAKLDRGLDAVEAVQPTAAPAPAAPKASKPAKK